MESSVQEIKRQLSGYLLRNRDNCLEGFWRKRLLLQLQLVIRLVTLFIGRDRLKSGF